MSTTQIEEQIARHSQTCTNMVNEISRVLVGQEPMVLRLLAGLLTGGHVLLEGVPGLAKTLSVRSLAQAIDTGFSRIQFTPDMLPADVIGTEVFNPRDATYSVKKGPIFSNLILADEINRAPAKVQAALLEAMQERQTTIGRQTYPLHEPFLVMATQNPIEQEGTYPLPEAQVDRFMLKVLVDYPSRDEERKIVDRMSGGKPTAEVGKVTSPDEILQARDVVSQIWVDDKVRDYVVEVVRATRNPSTSQVRGLEGMIEIGASPRASIYLMKAAKAHAFLQGRGYATPHDVKSLAPDVLRHRVILTYEAEAEGKNPDEIVQRILDNVPVPETMLAREIIQRVREIQIHTGRQVADVLAGQYVSVFKGRGIEFDEVRPYIPGDDVRTIDWNVTARMGEPFVKRYVEERQLTLMLMADISASQDFGSASRSKREATAELCALLAFSATHNDDKVGLVLFHGGIEQYIPPRKGQKHSLRVIREVLTHGTGETPDELARSRASRRRLRWLPFGRRRAWWRSGRQATNVAGAMEFLMSVTRRKTVCFVVSDFLDDGYLRALRSANRKHDVIAVLVTDPRELQLPNVGLVTLADPETGRVAQYDTSSKAFRHQLEQLARQRAEQLQHHFGGADIDFIHVDASGSVVDPLVKFFRMRERRMRR